MLIFYKENEVNEIEEKHLESKSIYVQPRRKTEKVERICQEPARKPLISLSKLFIAH